MSGERRVKINFGGDEDSGQADLLDDGSTSSTSTLSRQELSDPLPNVPTPSLHGRDAAKDLRVALLALLVVNTVYFILGSFAGAGDYFLGDLVLLLLGYYGQDLFRETALRLYFSLNIVAIVTDVFIATGQAVLASQQKDVTIAVWWWVIAGIMLATKLALKVFAAFRTKKLIDHLDMIPGQSV